MNKWLRLMYDLLAIRSINVIFTHTNLTSKPKTDRYGK